VEDIVLKKGILISLILLASQAHGYQTGVSTYVFADLLVWKLRESPADNWGQVVTPAGSTQSSSVQRVPFNWKPGIRIGAGKNLNYDCWDAVVYYTWYQTTGRNQASAPSGGVYSSFLGNFFVNNTDGASLLGVTYNNAGISWNLLYNTLDLELGRTFEIDEFLKLRPFIGLKAAVINQDINTYWRNPTVATTFNTANEDLKNNFWGIGPVIGFNSDWPFYKNKSSCFSLIGNLSGAILYGNWTFKDDYSNNTPTSIRINVSTISGLATMARGILGLEWRKNLTKSTVTVGLGYEAQIWFNQIQFYSLNMGRLNNLMSLQGAVFNFCFAF
jgi:hypothetical protein